jgi:hypothetical protein
MNSRWGRGKAPAFGRRRLLRSSMLRVPLARQHLAGSSSPSDFSRSASVPLTLPKGRLRFAG